jgi:hypothetical protein
VNYKRRLLAGQLWSAYLSIYDSTIFLLNLGCFFSFLIIYTVGSTPWTGDQPVGRLIPAHTEQHKHKIHVNARNTEIRALSGIRNHDPSVQASEDSSCLKPRDHCDRPYCCLAYLLSHGAEPFLRSHSRTSQHFMEP